MPQFENVQMSEPLASLADVSDRSWVLLGLGQLDDGSCFVADATDGRDILVRGYYDGATGDVLDCADASSPSDASGVRDLGTLRALASGLSHDEPAVHVIGSLDAQSGQVTVRQEQGNYLRIANWDCIDSTVALFEGAMLRTLPQCGCGGSLGAPKLFASFAEMSAYHFCAFYL